MRRLVPALCVVAIVAAGCSSGALGDGSAESPAVTDDVAVAVADDPTALLCRRWAEFAELMDVDREPSDALTGEVLERQRDIEAVLPGELVASFAAIAEWNEAFIEWFGAAGYQEVTEDVIVAVFGDQATADAAAEAVEAGFESMDAWSDRNCIAGEGDASVFCASWTDIAALLVRLDEEPPTEELVEELAAAYDAAGPTVPAEIRDHWNALLDFAAPYRDVLVTVEYDLDRVDDEILVQAFGTAEGFETLDQAADAGEEAISAWSLEGCGGFCARWGETREAAEMLGEHLGWVRDMGDEGPRRLQLMQSRIEVASQLVPPELAADWALLATALRDWFAWWEQTDFDGTQWESEEVRDRTLRLIEESSYFVDFALATWGGPEQDREQFLRDMRVDVDPIDWWTGTIPQGIASVRDRIDAWVDANCDVAGGRPGRLRVTWPAVEGAAGSTIVLAVMPPGAVLDDLGDLDARQAGFCEGVGRDPWGYEIDHEGNRHSWASEWFRDEHYEWDADGLCGWEWEAQPATLDAGPHTLLAAVVPGTVHGRELPAEPTACLALDVTIDGDTEIQLPPLAPCDADLRGLVYEPDPWRTLQPGDSAAPGAGTLRVTVPSLVLPEDLDSGHGGELLIVVLPAGTTLNDVGREEVWPAGGFTTYLHSRRGQPHLEELIGLGAVDVPILAVPPTGSFGQFDPSWLHEAAPGQLPLAPLAQGEYDVRVQITSQSEDSEERRCGQASVTIDGDTVIDMPELGDCP